MATDTHPHVSPEDDHGRGGPSATSPEARLQRLRARAAVALDRYVLKGEVARGGMGAILRAFDQDLDRNVAMKVMLGHDEPITAASSEQAHVLERFLDEALITGQLDHPGVVPVHELGLDARGRVYFTMRLIQGRTVDAIFELARKGEDGWTTTRALEVLLKVCDTLSYAHSKKVLHRDLKPSNVMVGAFGEVYVMDWGLAKVLGEPGARATAAAHEPVHGDRARRAGADRASPSLTMDGAVLGTPSYMPPEQAEGRIADLTEQCDVYAAGALLYTLLTGCQPYAEPGSTVSPHTVLLAVLKGPPKPVLEVDPRAPRELAAICARAMAREAGERYADMGAFAAAMRAYLERGVSQSKQVLAKSWLVAVPHALLVASWWFAWLLGGLFLLQLAIKPGSCSISVPVAFTIDAEGYRVQSKVPGVEPLRLEQCSGQLRFPVTSLPWGVGWAFGLILLAMGLVIIHQLRRLLAAAAAGEPFTAASVRRIRTVGWILLLLGVLYSVFETAMPGLLASRFDVEGISFTDSDQLLGVLPLPFRADYLLLGGGVAVLVLAAIFRLGTALEERRRASADGGRG
ncbi:MAG TPA: protein kinase [Planctomycetota bacterium]|nr:protein kinase [Planctomycetota bacterium]